MPLSAPSYSLSDPLVFDEFKPLIEWWGNRKTNSHAWVVSVSDLSEADWNLDQKNPNAGKMERVDIQDLLSTLRDYGKYTTGIFDNLEDALTQLDELVSTGDAEIVSSGTIGDFCNLAKGSFPTKKTAPGNYRFVVTAADARTADGFQLDTEAVCIPMVSSTGHGHAAIHRIHYANGKFALANIMAAVTPKPESSLLAKYLYYYLWRYKDEKLVSLMAGTANTSLTLDKLRSVNIEFPDVEVQRTIVEALDTTFGPLEELNRAAESILELKQDAIMGAFTNAFRERE